MGETEAGRREVRPLCAAAVGAQKTPQGFSPTWAPPPPLVSTGLETTWSPCVWAGHIRSGQRVTQVPPISGCAGLVLMHDFTGQGTRQRWGGEVRWQQGRSSEKVEKDSELRTLSLSGRQRRREWTAGQRLTAESGREQCDGSEGPPVSISQNGRQGGLAAAEAGRMKVTESHQGETCMREGHG